MKCGWTEMNCVMLIWTKELNLSRSPIPTALITLLSVPQLRIMYTSVLSKLPISEWLHQMTKPYLLLKKCNNLSIGPFSLYYEAFQIPLKIAEV